MPLKNFNSDGRISGQDGSYSIGRILNGAVVYIDDTVVYRKDEKNSCKHWIGLERHSQVQCQTQAVKVLIWNDVSGVLREMGYILIRKGFRELEIFLSQRRFRQ